MNGFIKQTTLFGKRIKCIIVIKFSSNVYFSAAIQVSMEIKAHLFTFQVSHSTNMISPLMLDMYMKTRFGPYVHIPVVFISNNAFFFITCISFLDSTRFRSTLLQHAFTVTIPNVCIFCSSFRLYSYSLLSSLCVQSSHIRRIANGAR